MGGVSSCKCFYQDEDALQDIDNAIFHEEVLKLKKTTSPGVYQILYKLPLDQYVDIDDDPRTMFVDPSSGNRVIEEVKVYRNRIRGRLENDMWCDLAMIGKDGQIIKAARVGDIPPKELERFEKYSPVDDMADGRDSVSESDFNMQKAYDINEETAKTFARKFFAKHALTKSQPYMDTKTFTKAAGSVDKDMSPQQAKSIFEEIRFPKRKQQAGTPTTPIVTLGLLKETELVRCLMSNREDHSEVLREFCDQFVKMHQKIATKLAKANASETEESPILDFLPMVSSDDNILTMHVTPSKQIEDDESAHVRFGGVSPPQTLQLQSKSNYNDCTFQKEELLSMFNMNDLADDDMIAIKDILRSPDYAATRARVAEIYGADFWNEEMFEDEDDIEVTNGCISKKDLLEWCKDVFAKPTLLTNTTSATVVQTPAAYTPAFGAFPPRLSVMDYSAEPGRNIMTPSFTNGNSHSDRRGGLVTPNSDGSVPVWSDETLHMIFDILDPGITNIINVNDFVGSRKKRVETREKIKSLMGNDFFSIEMFETMDEDGNGTLKREEFVNWCKKNLTRPNESNAFEFENSVSAYMTANESESA